MKKFCPTLSHEKHIKMGLNQSKELNPLKSLTVKVKPKKKKINLPTYPPTYIPSPTYPPKY